jgi:hypothetical protein
MAPFHQKPQTPLKKKGSFGRDGEFSNLKTYSLQCALVLQRIPCCFNCREKRTMRTSALPVATRAAMMGSS